MVAKAKSEAATGKDELVAGRYRLERRLARGGAGEVFVARDASEQRVVALKRMLPSALSNKALHLSFMREYHLLAQLRHPRIIEVYDYGVHEDAPYYTMELLDGRDLGELAPAPPRDVCRYLRDVASSLALLHARRMVHRDLSPRNVRLTSTGQCKLIDFGTVVAFGVAPNIAGTPPFVSPEALRQAALDPRTDLYALGALAYFLLTRTNAYPAHDFEALSQLQMQRLIRPSELVPLPSALDELIASLLELDPALRPRSATEVSERLSAIGELGPDGLPSVARSFVISPMLIGRSRELQSLEHALKQGLAGTGSATLIVGEQGVGRSRLLGETALLAQLRGFTTIEVFARGQYATPSLSSDLRAALHRNAPLEARTAVDEHAILATWDAARLPTGEVRGRLQAAMLDLLREAARSRPLLLAVDDIEQADDFTVALLAALAHEARSLPLVIVATRSSRGEEDAFSALANFCKRARLLQIASLDHGHTARLGVSMFGDVPNVERFSDWMYQATGGNPALIVELVQHLIGRGLVRYLEGTWALPAETITEAVPDNLIQSLTLKLTRISNMARNVAELMSIQRGGLTPLLATAALRADASEIVSALDELSREAIVQLAGQQYAFVQRGMRDLVERGLTAARKGELHAELARALLASENLSRETQLEAGWHLVHTPDELNGAKLLATVGPTLAREGLSMASAMPAIERALAVYERHGRPLAERLRLRAELVLFGYLFDYRLAARYGDETLEQLYTCSGFDVADRLSRYMPRPFAIMLSFTWFILRRRFTPRRQRAPHPLRLMQYIGRTVFGLIGMRATALDAVGTQLLAARVYTSDSILMPNAVRLVHLAARTFALQPRGCEAELNDAVSSALRLARKGRPWLLSESEYQELVTGLLLVDGINECYRERSAAAERAEELDRRGTHLAAAAAHRVRMIHHAFRGAQMAAEHERRQLELLGIQGGTTWQVELFAAPVEGLVAIIMGDVVATRRALDQLDNLLGHVPTLEPQRDAVRMGYHYLHGEYARVVELAEPFLARHAPRTVIGWGPAYALIVMCLAELGHTARALAICDAALSTLSDRDHEYFAMYTPLSVAHAWALALHGQRARSAELLGSITERLRRANEQAAVAIVSGYRARLAHRFHDQDALRKATADMRHAALATDNAALIAQAIRWGRVHDALVLPAAPRPTGLADLPESDSETLAVTAFLGAARGSEQDRRRLELLLQTAGCAAAHLYTFHDDQVQHKASSGENDPPSELDDYVRALLAERVAAGKYQFELAVNDNALPPTASVYFHIVVLDQPPSRAAVALLDREDTLRGDVELVHAAQLCLG